ncbi:type I restriction-modification system subunit M [Methanohalophilus profundi]|uniref:type I restriction-modification system subunit M n=1 Tax=Methanohalophilus profundi TaxID=2138083 RepID=UPI00101BE35D|nr:type I restriction-modification system subunit M [Methanohalophilus profundi]
MSQLESIEAIEKRLWKSADNLRANSNYASNEYFMPVMGLIFLRHAHSRFLSVKEELEQSLPKRGGKTRPLTKEDFSGKGAIYLKPESQFDYLVELPDSEDRSQAVFDAMESIENDYETLKGVLPKNEYKDLDNDVLGQLLRTFDDSALKKATGDIFGRIYEYFLTGFADQKAHDGGEFFTPVSLVQTIVNVIEPDHGKVLDPACGSGGMFVQSAHFIEHMNKNPTEMVTFYGLEKNPTTIKLAKMNLAVHGLEGNIQKAITYYEDPHGMVGKADFVMANPPFNVDEIDAGKIRKDPRLPFGLPGENNKNKVPNGNYVWINYFYSYLNERGRAGFVMSSQASSAGGNEQKVRQKLVESGDVDVMISIRNNFFYTRTVPCELWFLNKNKPEEHRDKVLMIDARNIYRQVTRRIYDFSPEQEQNIISIVWLYRGQTERFLDLIDSYCRRLLEEGHSCFETIDEDEKVQPLPAFIAKIKELHQSLKPLIETLGEDADQQEVAKELNEKLQLFIADVETFKNNLANEQSTYESESKSKEDVYQFVQELAPLSETSHDLIKDADLIYKLISQLIDVCEKNCDTIENKNWSSRDVNSKLKETNEARGFAVEQLRKVHYIYRHAHWLTSHFPDAKLCDVEGLVKLVDMDTIKENDWSLTPGRYVGIAPEEVDEDFDFEETLRDIHTELESLNIESAQLAVTIKKNFEELGI